MTAQIKNNSYNVSARCPNCKAISNFEQKHSVVVNSLVTIGISDYSRILYVISQCASCGRGGFAQIADRGNSLNTYLMDFYPFSVNFVALPSNVPQDIQAEFREAEKCMSLELNRAASALFRSVLEKTLKANGYIKSNDSSLKDLQKRIDAAAADGVITSARQKRAHEDIRTLGNDVLHDDWREVLDEEVETAYRYTQRILEDFYDDRPTTEAILIAKGKLSTPTTP